MGPDPDPDSDPAHVVDAATSEPMTVSMFVTDWIALIVWLRYQQQSSARHRAALQAVADVVSCFPMVWRRPDVQIGELTADSPAATFRLPVSVLPFLNEFGGEPPMARATRVWVNGQPIAEFAGPRHLG